MIYESDYFVGSALNGDSLSHEGVKGQRWGERHGPPYPIRDRASAKVHYVISKMTDKTRKSLEESGKLKPAGTKKSGESSKVENAAKSVVSKVSSSFKNWKDSKKADLVIKETNSKLMKNWQKKQLRISDMSNEELRARTERKKLEETYKHALRGDFSEAKGWYAAAKQAKSKTGKSAAAKILKTFGDAAVEGIAKGLTSRISYKMTQKSKGRVDRREARRDAIAEVMRDAAKERAKYRADRRNEAWKERQERRRASNSGQNTSKPLPDSRIGYRGRNYGSYYAPNTTSYGLTTSSNRGYYYASPDDWTIR